MSSIGPQRPTNAREKRKRETDDDSSDGSDSSNSIGPALPAADEGSTKKPRVIGPTLPPGIIEAQSKGQAHGSRSPQSSNAGSDDDDDDDDDDFGPSLPPPSSFARPNAPQSTAMPSEVVSSNAIPLATKRDDWMMVPPTHGDWSSRIDPTKMKSRKFNTGKGSKAPLPAGNAANTWHETPAEKQARLQREMMGVKDNTNDGSTVKPNISEKMDSVTAERIAEYNKSRGPTLYATHQGKQTEKDDDPSARAFDREKDIGGGLQLNSSQRRDLLKKASDFSSRFSSAKYL